MKIFTVIGARPQFIKAAVVSRALKAHRPDVREVLVHTGQHFDENMSDVFFNELDIPHPNHNLGIGGGTHGQNTGRMIERLEALMIEEAPDQVMVYGDTDSTLAAALAAAKLHVPVVHVEAGLRSFNPSMPEEINRVLTDHLATQLFAPTESARLNLHDAGISPEKIHVVGDVMYDAALLYKGRSRKPIWFDALEMACAEFVLCTIHRAENADHRNRMKGILNGLENAARPVILPLHPRTRKNLQSMGLNIPKNVHVVTPVGYLEMIWLELNCYCVVTDSGGVQKEAYFHGKPCVTLRDETEWTELVFAGWNVLAPPNKSGALEAAIESAWDKTSELTQLYGDGNAATKIALAIDVG